MRVENIQPSETLRFRKSIEANLTALSSKRGISVMIVCVSADKAIISIGITTNSGQVEKSLLLTYNSNILNLGWEVYYANKKYMLDSLTEISTITNAVLVSLNVMRTRV